MVPYISLSLSLVATSFTSRALTHNALGSVWHTFSIDKWALSSQHSKHHKSNCRMRFLRCDKWVFQTENSVNTTIATRGRMYKMLQYHNLVDSRKLCVSTEFYACGTHRCGTYGCTSDLATRDRDETTSLPIDTLCRANMLYKSILSNFSL